MSHYDYQAKYFGFDKTLFQSISTSDKAYIQKLAFQFHFTYQEFHKCCTIAKEIEQWSAGPLQTLVKAADSKVHLFEEIDSSYNGLRANKSYQSFIGSRGGEINPISTTIVSRPEAKILGGCPVASEKTLCCNLQTLDAVRNCGLDCSYCSIQSFFSSNEILMDADFGKKLLSMNFDPEQTYHIGTGQSSDSLMWGNKQGILDDLIKFAQKNPNVILEFKTKSASIDYLSKSHFPKNILTTWSLNPSTIIENEEHRTANLASRLHAARQIADLGRLVGFHFHPIIHYDNYQNDYQAVIDMVMEKFSPNEVALISMGTITFTKKVIKKIRSRNIKSKILQMPFVEVAGKLSYPDHIKEEMFSHLYNCFKPWHQKVFFYLCMEPSSFWLKTFGYKYADNGEFEREMKSQYMKKISSC